MWIPWSRWQRDGRCADPLARFGAVLLSARGIPFYRPRLDAAGLTAAAIGALGSIDEAVSRLPRLEWADFLEQGGALENSAVPPPPPSALRYPHDEVPRTVVLMAGFRRARHVRVVDNGWRKKLSRSGAQAIAAPVDTLRRLAEDLECGRYRIASPTHAVIAFSGPEQGLLSAADRNRFWRLFQVPLFEQFLGTGSQMLAWECDAHDGLHVEEDGWLIEVAAGTGELVLTSLKNRRRPVLRLATGLSAEVNNGMCGCGTTTRRLTALRATRGEGIPATSA